MGLLNTTLIVASLHFYVELYVDMVYEYYMV